MQDRFHKRKPNLWERSGGEQNEGLLMRPAYRWDAARRIQTSRTDGGNGFGPSVLPVITLAWEGTTRVRQAQTILSREGLAVRLLPSRSSVCTCTHLRATRSGPRSSRGAGVPAWGRCSAGRRRPRTAPARPDWRRWRWRGRSLRTRPELKPKQQFPLRKEEQ